MKFYDDSYKAKCPGCGYQVEFDLSQTFSTDDEPPELLIDAYCPVCGGQMLLDRAKQVNFVQNGGNNVQIGHVEVLNL